jgi:hypothetical protein
LSILFSVLNPVRTAADNDSWWNDDWSFRLNITIPINTSSENSKFQPVDVPISFNDTCWALNEKEHSVRVIFQDGNRYIELECQIYDLEYTDNEHIRSCNLVFLIPEQASGNEKYFVYYDDNEKNSAEYPEHIEVEESYYSYEPIGGFFFDSKYYAIYDDGEIVFGITKEGKYFNDPMSQSIVIAKNDVKEIKPNNGDNAATFSMVYWWKINNLWRSKTSAESLKGAQILVIGNLMVKIGVVTQSEDSSLKTTVHYKYYHNPSRDKRIQSHIKHEILKYPLEAGSDVDLSYATIPVGIVQSNSLEDLNFGYIPKYLHFYSDKERVTTYLMDQYPESTYWDNKIRKEDDFDLGNNTWISLDDGETGKALGLIFDTNNVIKSGGDEFNGVELQLSQSNFLRYPGLNARIAYVYLTRNSYDDGKYDMEIPEKFVAEFNVEVFVSEDGGYPAINKEAEIYKKLIRYQPVNNTEPEDDREEIQKYNITANIFNSPSFPYGFELSSLLGLKFSYIYAELYKQADFLCYGNPARLPLILHNIDMDDKTFFEKIKTIVASLDWNNFSIIKRVIFKDMEMGKYLLKIWRANTIFGNEKQFIGYKIINLTEDTKVNILCKNEGVIKVLLNPDNKTIKDATVHLLSDESIISESITDSGGRAKLTAPCGLSEKYNLNILYKGFLITKDDIRFGSIRRFLPLTKSYNYEVHNFRINIRYSNNTPNNDAVLTLKSNEMDYATLLCPDEVNSGSYHFKNIIPASYNLLIKFDQFEIIRDFSIKDDTVFNITLQDIIINITDTWNSSPGAIIDVTLKSLDFSKNSLLTANILTDGKYLFTNLYPGKYLLGVNYKTFNLEKIIEIPNSNNIYVFPAEFYLNQTIFDSRGNILNNVEIKLERDGKEIVATTNEDGKTSMLLPPGVYDLKIFNDNSLIAERKITFSEDINLEIVTIMEPAYPVIIFVLTVIFSFSAGIISYKKKNISFFLKILVILLIFNAIFTQWWTLDGSSTDPHLETSTKLYLIPVEMVSITSNTNVNVGEMSTLDEKFLSVTNILPLLLILGSILLVSTIFLEKIKKKKSSLLFLILSISILIVAAATFTFVMSEFGKVTTGSFYGSGNIGINVPGENIDQEMFCNWGPNIGFYLLNISIILSVVIFLMKIGFLFSKKKL